MPLYAQLTRAIRFAIATGRLGSGNNCQPCDSWRWNCASMPTRWPRSTPSWSAPESSKHEEAWERLSAPAISTASHREEHEKHLQELVDRFLEEAGAMGFSLDDLLDQLQSRRKKETN